MILKAKSSALPFGYFDNTCIWQDYIQEGVTDLMIGVPGLLFELSPIDKF